MLMIVSQQGASRRVDLDIEMATSWWERLKGLLGKRNLSAHQGLLLMPCGGIHTIGMRFTIDVVFLNNKGEACRICDMVVPFRLRFAPRGTHSVLELPAGMAKQYAIQLADRLDFDPL